MKKLPDIKAHFPDWYQAVVYEAELADQAPVRGCIVIRPYGNAIWELIKSVLDERIKATGHENAIFPLLIPQSFIEREADHIEGFAPELAVVTHAGGKKLEEPLVIRPTSETMVHYMFAKWIKSYRDLPLKINQWANVMRWEKRPRAFLRTSEFFWQEGHTAHATREEADQEAQMMLQEYVNLAENYLAIPVFIGKKSKSEQFGGAEYTLTFEAFMQDGKAVQMGTSHLLSQNFAKSFDMKFQDKDGSIAYPHLTSWGATTRLIGAVVGSHGDNKGIILPPRIAPVQVIIIPVFKEENKALVLDHVEQMQKELASKGIRVKVDACDQTKPGAKFFAWELKGVPVRIECGERDIQGAVFVLADRINGEKHILPRINLVCAVTEALETAQIALFNKAKERYACMSNKISKLADFGEKLSKEGGIYYAGWCENALCERELKVYQGSIRCLIQSKEFTDCFFCLHPSRTDVIIAKSY
jgi:prolyl-tRNA synthetase